MNDADLLCYDDGGAASIEVLSDLKWSDFVLIDLNYPR